MPRTLRPPDTTEAWRGLFLTATPRANLGFPAPQHCGSGPGALAPEKTPVQQLLPDPHWPRLGCHHIGAVVSDQGPKDALQPHSSSRNSLFQVHFPGPALCEPAVPSRGRQQHLKLGTAVLAQQLLAVLAELLLVPGAGLILLAG